MAKNKVVRIRTQNVTVTYIGGKEIQFQPDPRGGFIAEVTEDEAKELLNRPGGLYTRSELASPLFGNTEPSLERLDHEYNLLFSDGRLPVLRSWLDQKRNELEPMLLHMQQAQLTQDEASLIRQAQGTMEKGEVVAKLGGALPDHVVTGPDGTKINLGELIRKQAVVQQTAEPVQVVTPDVNVDGDEEEEEAPSVSRAKKLLKKKKKRKVAAE